MRRLLPSRFLFYLLLFFIPLQTRLTIFAPEPFIEYESGFLYITDLLLVALLVSLVFSARWRILKSSGQETEAGARLFFLAGGLLFSSFLSVFPNGISQTEWHHFLRLFLLATLFIFLVRTPCLYAFQTALGVLVASGFVQALIGLFQFFQQHDLGLIYLEAGPLSTDIDGVAEFASGGALFLRAYGTFPHPNILASFLIVSIVAWLFRRKNREHPECARICIFGKRPASVAAEVFVGFVLLAGLAVTFSRLHFLIAGIVFAFVPLLFFWRSWRGGAHIPREFAFRFLIVILVAASIVAVLHREIGDRFSFAGDEQGVFLRLSYTHAAFSMIGEHPFFGVGIGNFTSVLPLYLPIRESWMLQPVHNAYLLIASEIGMAGILFFLALIAYSFVRRVSFQKEKGKEMWHIATFSFLILALLFDHYFWTLQQGELLLWTLLGMMGRRDA